MIAKRTYERIFVHCTAASYSKISKQFWSVNSWHKDRFGYYFNNDTKELVAPSSLGYYGGYTIFIEPDGSEFRYREDREETMAVKNWNRRSLSVALAFDGDIEMPTNAQKEALIKRLKKWCEKYDIPTNQVKFVGPHRLEASYKTCYGSLLPDDWAIKLLNPVSKDSEEKLEKEKIEKNKQKILDSLHSLLLQLKILMGLYIKIINKRQK